MAQANILIGLGGTGSKIISKLATFLAQDGKWRSKADTDLYILLIDTDQGDITKFKGLIHAALPQAYLDTVHLSETYATLAPLVAEWSKRISNLEQTNPAQARIALKRFAEHWWFADPDTPSFGDGVFNASLVDNLTMGAGQVPAIGFLLAWHQLEKVSRAFNNLFDASVMRRGDRLQPDRVNSLFFGSLAGGTGRGTLIPLAFRYRMDFNQRFGGDLPLTNLYTFDSTCFEPVATEEEKLPQMMNALSGISEISAWLDLHEEGHQFDESLEKLLYRLPSERAPHDPSSDLIHFDNLAEGGRRDMKDMASVATRPFTAVSFTFRRSPVALTNNPEQLYEMIAAGLYVRLSLSSIDGQHVNRNRRLMAIGASTCRVDESAIAGYFRDKARFECLGRLVSPANSEELRRQATNEAKKVMETMFGAADARGALVIEDLGDGENAGLHSASILETTARLLFMGESVGNDALATFENALQKDDYRKAMKVVADQFDVESIVSDPEYAKGVASIFSQAVETYARANPGCGFRNLDEWMDAFVERVVGDDAQRDDPSILGRFGSASLASESADCLLQELDQLAKTLSIASIESETDERLPDLSLELTKRKGRDALVFGDRFNEGERQELRNIAQEVLRFVFAQAFGSLCASDDGPFGALRSRLRRIRANGAAVADAASRLIQGIDVRSLEDRKKKLFVTRRKDGKVDPKSLENAISQFDDPARFIYRTIKPLEPTDRGGVVLQSGPVIEEVRKVLLGDEIPEEKRDARKNPELTSLIDEAVDRNVRYVYINREGDNIVERNVTERFELASVLRELRNAWLDHFETKIGKPDFHDLCQKYENYFGIAPQLSPNGDSVYLDWQPNRRLEDNALPVLAMAASLVKTSAPFWQLYEPGEKPRVVCMIPIAAGDGNQRRTWREAIGGALQGQPTPDLVDNQMEADVNNVMVQHNPFMISCYVSEGCQQFDDIRSLAYWETNVELKKILERIEDPKKLPAVFATARARNAAEEYRQLFDGYRGSGFADSCYLHNPVLRTLRWRPWYPDRDAELNAGRFASMSWLALYAVYGPAWFIEGASCEAAAQSVMSKWSWPAESILEKGVRENIQIRRMPGTIKNYPEQPSFMENVVGIAYRVGNRVDQGIGNLVEVFMDRKDPRDGTRESSLALRKAIEEEYSCFVDKLGMRGGFNPQLNPQTFIEIVQGVSGRINQLIANSPPGAEHDRAVFEAALKHSLQLEEASKRKIVG